MARKEVIEDYDPILTIPSEIEGYPVTRIAPYAFYEEDKIDFIKLPTTIKEIGQGAFYTVSGQGTLSKDCIIGKYNDQLYVKRIKRVE